MNPIIRNKKLLYNYTVLEKLECGLVLKGWEVKSIKATKIGIEEGYGHVHKGEMWLEGLQITPLMHSASYTEEQDRSRKLLLHKKELKKLSGLLQEPGISFIPSSMYFKSQKVKVVMCVVKGKKDYDKRERSKIRDIERRQRTLLKRI